jgi:hypothetical protein
MRTGIAEMVWVATHYAEVLVDAALALIWGKAGATGCNVSNLSCVEVHRCWAAGGIIWARAKTLQDSRTNWSSMGHSYRSTTRSRRSFGEVLAGKEGALMADGCSQDGLDVTALEKAVAEHGASERELERLEEELGMTGVVGGAGSEGESEEVGVVLADRLRVRLTERRQLV